MVNEIDLIAASFWQCNTREIWPCLDGYSESTELEEVTGSFSWFNEFINCSADCEFSSIKVPY